MQKGKLVILSGPSSGVGKDTIIQLFLAKHPEWQMLPSVTTRKPRLGEVDGKNMIFTDMANFKKWQNEAKFVEAIEVDNKQMYGTLREPLDKQLNEGKNIILRKDVLGSFLIKEAFPEAIMIFVNAENLESLEQRIRARGTEDEFAIHRKLLLAKTEVIYQDKFQHVIINTTGKPKQAVEDLEKIVL